MTKQKVLQHGGARIGAGRKSMNGPTVVKRIPQSIVPVVDDLIKRIANQTQESDAKLPLDAILLSGNLSSVSIPLAEEKIPAGFPNPASSDVADYIDFNAYLVATPAATIVVRSGGLSMLDAGIDVNDLLIIDRSVTAKHGDIVMADLGNEFTIKRLYKKGNQIELRSENSSETYPNFTPTEHDTWFIVGVVRFVIKDVRR
ncbi:LexA family protein [Neisseria zalophi]|uniref:DNA polymerase V n=1 Tax=Neisseria zalophi TaxID=640030 RepID=A0A5J6PXG0_9NEIS|nr:translesion error-prone DNA polymerase V autoproteolytic subunit [Neisseria zalophi]QEY25803.1 DNA polymerase V [Neisseria zalophi]